MYVESEEEEEGPLQCKNYVHILTLGSEVRLWLQASEEDVICGKKETTLLRGLCQAGNPNIHRNCFRGKLIP